MRTMPIVTVDVALYALIDGLLHVGVMTRNQEPFSEAKALPGGYVRTQTDTSVEDSAVRVLKEKVGVTVPYLEQLYTFSGCARDPRGWSVSVAYCALIDANTAKSIKTLSWQSVDSLSDLAFDHCEIVRKGVDRVRSKTSYSSLPCYMLGEEFTLGELQKAYEDLCGAKLDKASFRRKLSELDFLEAIPGAFKTGAFRPAQLYRVDKLRLFSKEI